MVWAYFYMQTLPDPNPWLLFSQSHFVLPMSSTCYWNLLLWLELDICAGMQRFFDPVHARHPLASNSADTERSRCCAMKQGVGSDVLISHGDGKKKRGMGLWKWVMRAKESCKHEREGGGEGGGGGTVKEDEGQRWQLSRPTCPPIPRFPSWFASPQRDTCRGRPGKQEQVS